MCPHPEVRVDAIAARLSGAGFTPRVTAHQTHAHIDTEVPDPLPPESWRELFAALAIGDGWGVSIDSKSGRLAWAAVKRETPAVVGATRGRGRQL
ncbi:hypothetical protein GCM10010324_11870 [Streptomyces hiroshimensis]|uniref:Uncharacterized protein n=1 Tax=Streptomyces hiroshimensis TaxID=66424 RepID=A0ABQ2Y604_9ACTN|nr:hypothetical protein GCM10010324_11870 [Streptomyces hiroshimensis]